MTSAILTDGPTPYPGSLLNRKSASAKVTTWSTESRGASMAETEIPYTYVSRKKLKAGWREYWRYRRGDHESKLPGAPGDPAFHARYSELLQQDIAIEERKEAERHTVSWLIDQYLDSAEYRLLGGKTQEDYARILGYVKGAMGPERFDCVTRAAVKVVRDSFESQPRTAHKIKQCVSLLYTWADQNDHVEEGFNPCATLKKLKYKAKPIEIWSDEEIELFLSNCQAHMKTPVMIALYTGQRREDVVGMDWSAVSADFNWIRVRQHKTNEPLSIPCHPKLREHLRAIKTDFGGKVVRAADGRPMTPGGLNAALLRANAAIPNMPHRTVHGLRYAAAGALEAAGCTVVQISSVIGHRTYQMALRYMSQRREAAAAIAKMSA